MATRQITSSWLNQPEAVHAGVNALVIHLSFSTTFSPTDTIQIGKLPVNAIPLDVVFYGGTATSIGTTVLKFGTSASPSAFFTSATYSAARYQGAAAKRLGLAAQASLSDDKMPRYVPVQMVSAAGATLGYLGELVIYYKVPGQNFP